MIYEYPINGISDVLLRIGTSDKKNFSFTIIYVSDDKEVHVTNMTKKWLTDYDKRDELIDKLTKLLESKGTIKDPVRYLEVISTDVMSELSKWKSPKDPVEDEEKDEDLKYITSALTLSDVESVFKKWLYLRNIEDLHVFLAVSASQKLKGEDVWMMFVAPPSSMKSELIRTLGDKPNKHCYPVSEFTPQALATGHEEGKDLISKFYGKIATFKDFTTVLSGKEDDRNKIFGILREVYDGSFRKKFGGKVSGKDFEGHTTIIVGVTPIIDMYKTFLSQLGDRFLERRKTIRINSFFILHFHLILI